VAVAVGGGVDVGGGVGVTVGSGGGVGSVVDVGGGVSVGAAVSYAQMLRPSRAGAATAGAAGLTADEHYPLVHLTIKSRDLATVIQKKKIRLLVSPSEQINFVRFDVFVKIGNSLRLIAITGPRTFAPGDTTVTVPVNVDPLRGRDRAKIFAFVVKGTDNQGNPAFASAVTTLRR
jgi:hypothetical protein